MFKKLFLIAISAWAITPTQAKEAKEPLRTGNSSVSRLASDCRPAASRATLDINNVRALILGGGDYWWDQGGTSQPRYEIPRIDDPTRPKAHSLFAGSVWIGGIDADGQLRVAAQTYRQATVMGVGWWPGPLNTINATTNSASCSAYDKLWKINRAQIFDHENNTIAGGGLVPGYAPPADFMDWPGNGDASFGHAPMLAPFKDVDGDGVYNPMAGDYPDIFGDQSLFCIINDRGNVSGSGARQIGMEMHVQAFAYRSNDNLNNMTFYYQKIINRSTLRLDSCYMGQWIDPDLGNPSDDFVGCDVPRGLGICYNGDDDDETIQGYGLNPPSVGVDFFEGPFSDPNDGLDNNRNCLIDELLQTGCDDEPKTERIIMSKFVYFNNDGTVQGNPRIARHAFNYLTGFWQDNVRMVYGGTGYPGSTGATNIPADMMFPGSSDGQIGWSIGGTCQSPRQVPFAWSEINPGPGANANTPADRRFIHSAGPFTLESGAVNFVTIGVVWARASSGGATGSFAALLDADTKAQAVFDNCFKVLDGPDAPDVNIVELDQEIVLNFTYRPTSNNFGLKYNEVDPILRGVTLDSTYKFEGFQIYELASGDVSSDETFNADRARLIQTVDIKNGITTLVNWESNERVGGDTLIKPFIKAQGPDEGIKMSFRFTRTQFPIPGVTTGGDQLINNKQYHYLVVAYSYNNYQQYAPERPGFPAEGQPIQYYAGRRTSRVVAVPHKSEPKFGGLILQSTHGTMPQITKIEGIGNGGNTLDLEESTIEEILNSPEHRAKFPVYKMDAGPIALKVVDPTRVPKGKLLIGMNTSSTMPVIQNVLPSSTSRWFVVTENRDTIFSDSTLAVTNEQILLVPPSQSRVDFTNLGLSLLLGNIPNPGEEALHENGNGTLTTSSITYSNIARRWFQGMRANNVVPGSLGAIQSLVQSGAARWVRAGRDEADLRIPNATDPFEFYEKVLDGTWTAGPFINVLADFPGWNNATPNAFYTIRDIASVDVVLTPNKALWSRSAVIELAEDATRSEGGQSKNRLRAGRSVDKDGNPVADPTDFSMGWFPGYAINIETGERLNIMFGEASDMPDHNGRDMIWNPTATAIDFSTGLPRLIWGGKHAIYIMKSRYDSCAAIKANMAPNGNPLAAGIPQMRLLYPQIMWGCYPKLAVGQELLSSEVNVRLRVGRSYGRTPSLVGQTRDLPTSFTRGDVPVLDPFFADNVTVNNVNNFPKYIALLDNVAAIKNDVTTAKKAMDIIRAVPNPYYAYSDYETSAADNNIKFTNLPQQVTIRIYTLSGILIRTLRKDSEITSLDWDLKNDKRVPIASGMYLIHIDAGSLGQRTLKWFGVMRPLDLDSF